MGASLLKVCLYYQWCLVKSFSIHSHPSLSPLNATKSREAASTNLDMQQLE